MRCGLRWDGITRIARYALLSVVLISTAPTPVFAQQRARVRAEDESLVCHTIRRSESATQVARRITGDSRNAYQAWFQIRNPSSRFVPKSQYDRIRPGWRACVPRLALHVVAAKAIPVKGPDVGDASEAPESPESPESARALATSAALAVPAALPAAAAFAGTADRSRPLAFHLVRTIGSVDLIIVWLGAALAVPWFGWRLVDGYLARRKTAAIVMRHFADRFVAEFERPLVRYDVAQRPVRSRLRFKARPGRFDILLAPGDGRRYPNLSDHKKNLEYDVARVLQVLSDESFVSRALYMQAEWVVVPFIFRAGPKQAGVTCISSL
jgi:hypothetical protein